MDDFDLPFAKPRRFVSQRALKDYVRENPRCELERCRRPGCPEPNHLVPRARGRNDSAENLLSLCIFHHREWHDGPHAWWRKYQDQLAPGARAKVAAALRIEE